MRPERLLLPVLATVVVAAGCAAAGPSGRATRPVGPAARAGAGESSVPQQASGPFRAVTPAAAREPAASPQQAVTWSQPGASVKAAPSAVTGVVTKNQPVRIVRLAEVKGVPVVSVVTAFGPIAAAAAVREAQREPGSIAVNVDHRVQALDQAQSDDPLRSQQWALTTLDAEATWVHSRGAGVTVAVIDTGVAAVPDLTGQLLPGYDWVTGSAGGNADGFGHGTHVAGIISAVAGNGIGVAGIAPDVKILPLRVLGNDGSGDTSDVASAVIYATQHGAKVINMSLGGTDFDQTLADAVSYAQAQDVVVVAAAGNDKQQGSPISYPAALPNVVAVGATDHNNTTAYFSNTGSYLKVSAPGVDIESTVPTFKDPSGYEQLSGTSMATPYAAGVVALTRAAAPSLDAADIENAVYSTATDLGATGWDATYGYGLVEPLAAVCSVSDCTNASPSTSATPSAGVTPTDSPTATPTAADTPTEAPSIAPTPSPTTAVRTTTNLELTRPAASLKYGASAVFTVHLQTENVGLSGRRVLWCDRVGSAAPACIAMTTVADGLSQVRFTPSISSTIYATFAGDALDLPAASAQYGVAVIPAVSLRVGHRILAVKVAPGSRQRFEAQRWTGRAWVRPISD